MLFLAGGLAFNVLLALLPFLLLLISGLSFLLGSETTQAANTVTALVDRLLPSGANAAGELLRGVIADVLNTRGAVTAYSAIGFAWFSTRLFGSLRSVLALIFDGTDRGIVAGKVFDFIATIIATVAIVVYVVISTYIDLATTRGLALLQETGLRTEAMGFVGYLLGRLTALTVVFLLFYAMYRGLPRRRPSMRTAAVGALSASILFEIARHLFVLVVARFDPSSLYTGTIAAIVAIVFWTYYGALLFLIGGEVAQAFDLRRNELAAQRFAENTIRAAAAATGTSLADFAACADTVMVSFSKGLGAPVGACLVGPADLITRAHRVRKRFGGGMRQSGILAAGALYGLEHHLDRLAEDHEAAKYLAHLVDGVGGAKVVMPDTNIVMIDLPTPRADDVVARAAALGVRVYQWHNSRVRAVAHLDAPIGLIAEHGPKIAQALSDVLA